MKDDDKIEVVDLSPEGDAVDSIKDFLDEQMEYLNSLIAAAAAAGPNEDEPVEVLAAYVRGAIAASDEAIVGAWPELRDKGTLSSENGRRVSMTGALCGMMVPEAQKLTHEPDQNLRAIGLLIMLQLQQPAAPRSGPSAAVAKAVTLRATADEMVKRARDEEAE